MQEADPKRLKACKHQDSPELQPEDSDTVEKALWKCEERFRAKLLDASPPGLQKNSGVLVS